MTIRQRGGKSGGKFYVSPIGGRWGAASWTSAAAQPRKRGFLRVEGLPKTRSPGSALLFLFWGRVNLSTGGNRKLGGALGHFLFFAWFADVLVVLLYKCSLSTSVAAP